MTYLPFCTLLLTKSELRDDSTVTLDVFSLQISEKVAAATYHLEQTAVAVLILRMLLEVLIEVVDAVCQKSYLYLRGTCIGFRESGGLDDFLLVLKHVVSPFFSFAVTKKQVSGESVVRHPPCFRVRVYALFDRALFIISKVFPFINRKNRVFESVPVFSEDQTSC